MTHSWVVDPVKLAWKDSSLLQPSRVPLAVEPDLNVGPRLLDHHHQVVIRSFPWKIWSIPLFLWMSPRTKQSSGLGSMDGFMRVLAWKTPWFLKYDPKDHEQDPGDRQPLYYGHKFHKTVQPTAWSRRKNICGLNPLTIPIGLLTRHGASEFGLRLLSEGRFLGIITTRSIAESVSGAQLLKAMRDQGVDIDTLSALPSNCRSRCSDPQ